MKGSGRSALRVLRAYRGMTQADLARACGISTGALSNFELGLRKPSPDLAAQLARQLGFSPEAVTVGVDVVACGEAQATARREEASLGKPAPRRRDIQGGAAGGAERRRTSSSQKTDE